jgi:hypothetical protein
MRIFNLKTRIRSGVYLKENIAVTVKFLLFNCNWLYRSEVDCRKEKCLSISTVTLFLKKPVLIIRQ